MADFYIGKNGKQMGPYPESQVRSMLANGTISLEDLAWQEGMAEWVPLEKLLPAAPARPSIPSTPPGLTPPAYQGKTGPGSYQETGFAPLASRWTRLGAHCLDTLIWMAFMIPGIIVGMPLVSKFFTVIADHVHSGNNASALTDKETEILEKFIENPENQQTMVMVAIAFGGCMLLLFLIQVIMLSTRGQTMGKRLAGVKIVKVSDDSNPGFVGAFLLRAIVPALISMVPVVGGFFGLIDVLFIFNEDNRCLHDKIAGTKVVKA